MTTSRLPLALALCLLPTVASAQDPSPSGADSALADCLMAANETSPNREALNSLAEAAWRAEVARQPDLSAPRVGLARVLVQCRLGLAAGPSEQLGLFQEAVAELTRVVKADPGYWPARLTLGLTYARAPAFLGYAKDAIVQLEFATSDLGIPTGRIELAEALQELALLYDLAGRAADAAAVRDRARRLFPNDRRFSGVPEQPPPGPGGAATVLPEITVTAVASSSEASRRGEGFTPLEIVTLPGGTGDLMQGLQTLPGVTGGSESSDLSLRGGDPYESPVLLNGARLVYAGTFESLNGGLFGVIDPEILRAARVYPGAFSARFGDALSGIIEADAIGRPAARSRRVALNTAGPSATVMQPLGEHAGAWGSFRVTNTELMLRMHGRRDDYGSAPTALEGVVSGTRVLTGGELHAVVLGEFDEATPELTIAGHSGGYRSRGSTVAAVLSGGLAELGPLSSLRFNATASSRSTDTRFGALDYSRRLQRVGVRAEGGALVGGTMFLRGGVEASHLRELLDGTVPTTESFAPESPVRTLDNVRRSGDHLGAFTELLLSPAAWVTVTPGLRVDRLPGEQAWTADPRLGAEVRTGAFTISLAGGVFHQGSFRPTRDEPGLDTRTGVPRRARHVVLGVERRGRVTLRADAYGKLYDRFVGGTPEWRPRRGSVIGADVFVRIPGEQRSARLTYSVMRGRLSLGGDRIIPSGFDVTHSVVGVLTQRLLRVWEIGTTARFATGRPFTATVASADGGSGPDTALGPANGDRYPAYLRLDARLSRYSRLGGGLLVSYLEVLNVTGRRNVVGYGTAEGGSERIPITTFFSRRTVVVGAELR